jgi:hypothetical protein
LHHVDIVLIGIFAKVVVLELVEEIAQLCLGGLAEGRLGDNSVEGVVYKSLGVL